MKKLILFLFLLFFTTSCYDYQEVNDLAFISAVGIDYKEDKYEVTFEILSTKKTGENETSQETYTESGTGKSLSEAFDNITVKISNIPYYFHLKAVIISEKVAKDHMKEFIDFTVRSSEVRNEFYIGVAHECDAKDIIKASSKNNPVVGEFISKIVKSNIERYNISFNKPFEDVLEKILNKKQDAIATSFKLNNDSIEANGIALFKGYEYVATLSKDDSALLNTMMGSKANMNITKKYDDKSFIINIYNSESSISFKDDTAFVEVAIEADIKENGPEFNLGKEETYIKLSEDFSRKLTEECEKLITKLIEYDVDPLGINSAYYKDTKKDVKDIYKKLNVQVKAKVTVNKNGLIFGGTS